MTTRKRGRRTDREKFIDTLETMGGKNRSAVGNKSLRDRLNWSAEKYNRIKDSLLDSNQINRAKGGGGAVCLPPPDDEGGLSVFISYAHKDKELKTKLINHLKPLERINLIKTWHDQEIKPGQEWAKSITEKINRADLILLLISVDFINSDFCYETELERAMERHEEEEARVIPIILRDCLWNHAPFAKLQALPQGAKAITSWGDLDTAMKEVARGVETVAQYIRFDK